MSKHNLSQEAHDLPVPWQSRVVGKAAGANVKVLRMDATPYANEAHDFAEALLVLEGHMNLEIKGQMVRVGAGEIYIVPAGEPHAVAPGSHGTLVIIDQ
ncbi:MAG: cupin domain-containing protein [Betaproteobacteria bacterium]|nr:cupin domain-containing protein [Betaproteobacteria bacterium]